MAITIEEFVAELGWEIDTKGLKQFSRQVDNVKKDLRTLAKVGVAASAAIAYGFTKVMKSFSLIEDSEAAFQPVLGSLEKAEKLVQKLTDTASTTPFQFETLSKAAKQLLPNMGKDVELTIDRIRMLGDTAGGQATKMDSIVRGYNKALLKGKVDMESLNMISEAGVPIINELAAAMGMETGPKFFKMITAGKVSTDDLNASLKRMTSEGGIFFRGMEIASRTLSGRLSTLKDNVSMTAADVGGALAPAVKEVVEEMLGGVGGIREWVRANKDLIRSEGAKWIRKFADAAKDAWLFLKKVNEEVQELGGWGPTLRRIGIFFAAWKLGPLVIGLSKILGSLTAIKGVGLAKSLGLAGLKNVAAGGLLALIPLLIEDIMVSLRGGKGAFYEWGDGIAVAAMGLNELAAEMLEMPLDEFNVRFIQGLNDIGEAWGSADDAVRSFFEHLLEYIFQALISVDRFGDMLYTKIKGAVGRAWDFLSGIGFSAQFAAPGQRNDRLLAPSPSGNSSRTTNNDNRSYNVRPSATINQSGTDLRRAERAIGQGMERQFNNALRTMG